MRILGPVLEFDTVSKNKVIFYQSCKITIPHIIPVYFERDNFVIGYCEGFTVANVEKIFFARFTSAIMRKGDSYEHYTTRIIHF